MIFTQVIKQLQKEQKSLQTQLQQINHAMQALNGLTGGRRSVNIRRKSRRKISAAGRARISIAQKARWAKVRKSR